MSDCNSSDEIKDSLAKLRTRLNDLGLLKREPPRQPTPKRGRPRKLQGHRADASRKQALANYWTTDIQEIWARHLMSRLKRQAREQGIEFDLCKDDLKQLADESGMMCAVLGIPLRYGRGAKGGRSNLISVDRIDPNKPFTADNMNVVCGLVRIVLGLLTMEQCITLGHYCEMMTGKQPDADKS